VEVGGNEAAHHSGRTIMNARRLVVGRLTAAALAATAPTSTATALLRMPDPAPHAARPLAETANELAFLLAGGYAATHQRRLHTEMVLVRHNPICAVS
jgi:hypothetical protein